MTYQMVVLDLDGTVVNESGLVSQRTRSAVRAARNAGVLVVVATGRRLYHALPVLRQLGVDGPSVFCNGAVAVDLTTWRTLLYSPMRAAGTAAAAHWLRAGLAPLVCRHSLKGPDLLYQTPSPIRPAWLSLDDTSGHLARVDALPTESDGALKLMALDHLDVLRAVAISSGLPGRMMLTECADGTGLLEMWREDVSKATAVRELAERAGIGRRDIIAFGDNSNDVELLAYAGMGVAVGNATPEAKAAARAVCGPCAEDGVAEVLESVVRSLRAAI